MPPKWLAFAEIPRLFGSLAALPWNFAELASAPLGDGSTVLVIPGFAASDGSTAILRAYLAWLGYDTHGWELGRNLGARTIGVHNEALIRRFDQLRAEAGQKPHVIGWSMGGIMARMLSRARPDDVEQLILLGSPFAGDPYANHAWQLYEKISGHSLSDPVAQAQIAESKLPPPVRSASIYSKSDGVVAWDCCLEPAAPHTQNIEVDAAHCAMAFDAKVLRTVADLLAKNRGRVGDLP
jgi:pimeloyl-ACP methyl ester carboxylesterase